MKKFVNLSTFAGWVDYFDDYENQWRREDDNGALKFYKIKGDSLIFEGAIKKKQRLLGIEKNHKAFIESQNDTA